MIFDTYKQHEAANGMMAMSSKLNT